MRFKSYVTRFFKEEDGDVIQTAAVLVLSAILIAAIAVVFSSLKSNISDAGDQLNSAFDAVKNS